MIALPLFIAAALGARQQQTPPVYMPPPKQQTVVRDSTGPDTSRYQDAGRRRPVTAQLLATAFKNPATRELFLKARQARLEQDSALKNYDATSRERMSVNLGIGSRGREHLFYRRESSARVRWQHDVGAVVDLTGWAGMLLDIAVLAALAVLVVVHLGRLQRRSAHDSKELDADRSHHD
jgi:hypothetical protein